MNALFRPRVTTAAAAPGRLRPNLCRLQSTRLPPALRPQLVPGGRKLAAAVRCQRNASSSATFDDDGDGTGAFPPPTPPTKGAVAVSRVGAALRLLADTPAFRLVLQYGQFAASVLFVGLYVWGTYSTPARGSPRYLVELLLCLLFAVEYAFRLAVHHPDPGSKLRMVTSPRNVGDLLSFAPPLVEVFLQSFVPGFSFGRVDLRWFKLLRSMRVMRIGLLGSELRSLHLSTKRGGWLSAGANFRLVQLATSLAMLLFMATAIIQIVEQIPFHRAMYFVATTLSTVGYGDVVAKTLLGRTCVLVMLAAGLVLIPVQAAQFYSELSARRVVRGRLPDAHWRSKPFVLLSTRLTEVRAFSDFLSEFRSALGGAAPARQLPASTRLVALGNRPSFEFTAFQELHERQVTLVEGSAVSGQDLITVKAERAQAILLMADRFTTDPEQEDLGILFQVWACKSYTKSVPLFVQTVRQATVRQVAPFLDPGQDVVVSMEQTRFRLLALSAVCPGASTLVGNLLRSSAVLPPAARGPTLAGRRWLREYVGGCEWALCQAPVPRHLAGLPFLEVAEWLYRSAGQVLVGIVDAPDRARLNPGAEALALGASLLVMAPGTNRAVRALRAEFVPLNERLRERVVAVGMGEHADGSMAGGMEAWGWGDDWDAGDEGEAQECVPVMIGNPDSDSVDPDSTPCMPPDLEQEMLQATDRRAFLNKYGRGGRHPNGNGNGGGGDSGGDGAGLSGHFILCGHSGSIVPFMEHLRAAEPSRSVPIVVLSPEPPRDLLLAQQRFGPVVHVRGSPAEASCLRAAGAAAAKALVFLARSARPVKTAQATGAAVEVERSTREAVLADADALLACYGVGEESGAALTHAVVELLFTTSIEFLQPGLLLKGVNLLYDDAGAPAGAPRKSWAMRAWQQREAVAEGLAEWQANPYYAAGRVTVPALMDAFATQCFFNRGLLISVLAELAGDLGGEGPASEGAMLQQVAVPPGMAGRTYGECFMALSLGRGLVPLGLYRRKSENSGTRLSYVVANPAWHERLQVTDRVFVLCRRPGS